MFKKIIILFALLSVAVNLQAQAPEIIWSQKTEDGVEAVKFHPNGETFFVSITTQEIQERWTLDGSIKRTFLEKNEGRRLSNLDISKDGKYLVGVGNIPYTILINLESGEVKKHKNPRNSSAETVSFSPDGTRFAASGQGGCYKFWVMDTETGDSLYYQCYFYLSHYPDGDPPLVKHVKWSNNGGFIVGVSQEPVEILIYNDETYKLEKRVYLKSFDPLRRIALSNNDQNVLVATDESVYLHNIITSKNIIIPSGYATDMKFFNRSDSLIIATGNWFTEYNIEGEPLPSFKHSTSNLAIHPNDSMIITSDRFRILSLVGLKMSTGIKEETEDKLYRIFQEDNIIIIEFSPENVVFENIIITDISGKQYNVNIDNHTIGKHIISTISLPSGAYLLNLEVNGAAHTEKIVIRR